MKTARLNRGNVRSEDLMIKMTAGEKNAVMREADKAGLTMSAWVRMVLNERISKN